MVSWAFARVGVHHISLCLPYLGVFHSLFFTCHWISFVFLLYDWCIRTIGRPFTYSPNRWVSRLGTFSGTRCCGPRGGAGVRMKPKSRFKFLPWPRFEPRTLQSGGRERHHQTMAHPLYIMGYNNISKRRHPKTWLGAIQIYTFAVLYCFVSILQIVRWSCSEDFVDIFWRSDIFRRLWQSKAGLYTNADVN